MPNVRYYIFLLGMLFLAPACREKTASDFEIWGLDGTSKMSTGKKSSKAKNLISY